MDCKRQRTQKNKTGKYLIAKKERLKKIVYFILDLIEKNNLKRF